MEKKRIFSSRSCLLLWLACVLFIVAGGTAWAGSASAENTFVTVGVTANNSVSIVDVGNDFYIGTEDSSVEVTIAAKDDFDLVEPDPYNPPITIDAGDSEDYAVEGIAPETMDGAGMIYVIKVDVDGDNEEDGDVDADDDAEEENLPVVVAINEDTRELTVRKVGVSSVSTLKIKKSGDGKITLKKSGGATVLGEGDSESIDILSDAGSSDLVLTIDGTEVGDVDLELEFVSGVFSCSDLFKVKVVKSDIVQRKGNTALAVLIGEDFTHSGIEWEQYVTDIFDPGIERISLTDFVYYASDPTKKKRLRLKKSLFMVRRVWAKVYDNMEASSYSMPTGAKPWNLFTTSTDYSTANCNEFVHEQFQKAVADVYGELTKPVHQASYQAAYYTGSAVSELADDKHVTILAGKTPFAGPRMAAMVGYVQFRSKQVGATTLFENVYEGEIPIFWYHRLTGSRYDAGMGSCSVCGDYPSLPWYLMPVVELWDEAHQSTITPSGFSGSTYFETITY